MRRYSFVFFALFFVALATGLLITGIFQNSERRQLEAEGVRVTATITDIIKYDRVDDTDYDVFFTYTYDGSEYTYCYYNYPGSKKIGVQEEAYIYPDRPSELFIPTGNIWIVVSVVMYIMTGFYLFLIWITAKSKRSQTKMEMAIQNFHKN